jgi:hypothetical protein
MNMLQRGDDSGRMLLSSGDDGGRGALPSWMPILLDAPS